MLPFLLLFLIFHICMDSSQKPIFSCLLTLRRRNLLLFALGPSKATPVSAEYNRDEPYYCDEEEIWSEDSLKTQIGCGKQEKGNHDGSCIDVDSSLYDGISVPDSDSQKKNHDKDCNRSNKCKDQILNKHLQE
jgi:hypothetical protein